VLQLQQQTANNSPSSAITTSNSSSLGALKALAALAATLSEVELKICLHLAPEAIVYEQQHPGWFVAIASVRKLADATGAAKSSIQSAVASLVTRGHLEKHRGSAETSSNFLIKFIPNSQGQGVPEFGTGVCRNSVQGVPEFGTGVCRNSVQGVPEFGTPPHMSLPLDHPHARARRSDSDSDSDRSIEAAKNPHKDPDLWKTDVLERVAMAAPEHFAPHEMRAASQWLQGYATKFGPGGYGTAHAKADHATPHPPDGRIVAQFLSIAPWHILQNLIQNLMDERITPGAKYGAWFVAVALQRIHNIAPELQRAARASLRIMPNPTAHAHEPPQDFQLTPPRGIVPALHNATQDTRDNVPHPHMSFTGLSMSKVPGNRPALSHGEEELAERTKSQALSDPSPGRSLSDPCKQDIAQDLGRPAQDLGSPAQDLGRPAQDIAQGMAQDLGNLSDPCNKQGMAQDLGRLSDPCNKQGMAQDLGRLSDPCNKQGMAQDLGRLAQDMEQGMAQDMEQDMAQDPSALASAESADQQTSSAHAALGCLAPLGEAHLCPATVAAGTPPRLGQRRHQDLPAPPVMPPPALASAGRLENPPRSPATGHALWQPLTPPASKAAENVPPVPTVWDIRQQLARLCERKRIPP